MEVNQNSKATVESDIISWNSHLGENHLLQWQRFPVTTASQHLLPWRIPRRVGTQCVACIYWAKDPRGPPHHLVSPPRGAVGGRAELSWAWSAGNVVFSLAATLFTERIPRHNEEMLEINQSRWQHSSKFNCFCPAARRSERFLVVSVYKHVVRELLHRKTQTAWVYVTRCHGKESKSVTVSHQTDSWI